ncbi:hypothetical protein [Paludibaculum fermentans]|uniref:hypothetical protein n=1 Tax=Paludibaculum fermentans TaxID=1473598 RepID=UPI003EBE9FEE
MRTTSSGVPEWFGRRVRVAEALQPAVGVVLVANIQGRTEPFGDYEGDSVISEFLTNRELDQFIGSFEDAGIYCEVVIDEEGFLNWLADGVSSFPRRVALVYNLAQNGTGPARLSLVPGLCRLRGLPLIDSDAYAVSLARHKFHSCAILRHFGLPVANSWLFTSRGWLPDRPPQGLRVIAKPTYESASIGIDATSTFSVDASSDKYLAERARIYRQPLTVQEFINGFEVEVPVFDADGPQSIMAVGIAASGIRRLDSAILRYDDVRVDGYTFYDFAEQAPSAAIRAMAIAGQAFHGLGLSGVGRIDFRITDNGEPFIIEVACKPHLTDHSSFMCAVHNVHGTQADMMKFIVGAAALRHGICG